MPANIQGSNAPRQDITATDNLRVLIRDCIAWNRRSQQVFYETYARVLYNVVKRYVFNDAAAQEILSDSFYKIFTRLEQFAWQGPIEAWMRRITVNTVTDHLRKYIKDEYADIAELAEEDAYVDNTAVSNLSFAELIGCTGQLTHIQRTVFNLYVLEGLSHKEIGAMLFISAGNSRWILNAARKNLKQIITSMQ